MAASRKPRTTNPEQAAPRTDVLVEVESQEPVSIQTAHVTGKAAEQLLENKAELLGLRLRSLTESYSQDREKGREREREIAALIGDIQLRPFRVELTGGKTRLDFFKCVEERNNQCLRVYHQRQPRAVSIERNPANLVLWPGTVVGYSLVIPLKPNYDTLLRKDPLTYFNASYATDPINAKECIAKPGEPYSTLLIEEVVSFPFSSTRREVVPSGDDTSGHLLKCVFIHVSEFLPGLGYSPESGFTCDLRELPKLLCWSPRGWRGGWQAKASGFKEVENENPPGFDFARLQLDLSQKLEASEVLREKKVRRRIDKLKTAVLDRGTFDSVGHQWLTSRLFVIDAPRVTRGAEPQQTGRADEAGDVLSLDQAGPAIERPKLTGLEALRHGEIDCEALHNVAVERFKQLLLDLEGFQGASSEERHSVARRLTRQAHRLGLVLMAETAEGHLVPVTIRCTRQSFQLRMSGGGQLGTHKTIPKLQVAFKEELTSAIYK